MSLLDNLSRDCITRTVDPIGLKHTFAVAATQPVVQHAIDIIDRYMWTDGIEIHYNNKPMELTPYFRNHLETHWKSLVKDILVWILCTGVLPVTFKILPDGTWVPKIVKPGGGHINSVYRDNVQHFTYVRYGEYYPDEETIVLHGFGYDPTIDGALTSPISSLSLQQTCIRIFLDAAAEAEKIRCNPTLVLQMRKDNTEREQVYGVDYGYYAEADVSSERAKLMTYNKDLARAERVGYLNDSKKTPSSRLNPGVFRAWDDNKFYVPSSWEVVHQILPETRRDLVPLLEYTDAQIYNILGIPESVAKGNLGNKVGNIQATNDIFKTTIKWWKQTLSQVFTTCYNIIYGASDMAFLMQNVIANSNKEGEISNESGLLLKNMHDIVSEKGFEVVLPNTPFVSMDELFLLAQTGVITPEEYQMYMRKLANLPLLQ